MTDINNTDTNESQGVTLVTSDIDNRTKSAMLDAIVSVIMNNEEQAKSSRRHLSTKQRIMQGTYWGELREYYHQLLITYHQVRLYLL